MLTDVKIESRILTGDGFDNWVKSVITEIYLDECENNNYPELDVRDYLLTIPTDAAGTIALPTDFKEAVRLRFSLDDVSWGEVVKENSYPVNPRSQGYPAWFVQTGANILVYPYSEVLTTHYLRMDYLSRPAEPDFTGSLTTDVPVVYSLYPVIKKKTIARVLRIHGDNTKADASLADAADVWNRQIK